jgi:bacillithiol biosynthesis cysteine-adding enzyme BshC
MHTTAQQIAYRHTGYFTDIVISYLQGDPLLQPFYQYAPDWEGLDKAIAARKETVVDRKLLTEVLREQYQTCSPIAAVQQNIDLLAQPNTFTVTTAHQPNLFTGPLYFIYKCLHAVKLAQALQLRHPNQHFVPVYYMGSEDADLEEIGQLTVGGIKLVWKTKQTGAVGRMKVDQPLLDMIAQMEGQTGVEPFGKELSGMWRTCFTKGKTIAQATHELVHLLMGAYGLVVFNADHPRLKAAFIPTLWQELTTQFSHQAVATSISALSQHFKAQAAGRDINLFYLLNDRRERIEKEGDHFTVPALQLRFTETEMEKECRTHPERFSPNVILRGVLQETLLPNVAFIGGGGELAYWLELLPVFRSAKQPFPVLLLRNSFLLLSELQNTKWLQTGFSLHEMFTPVDELITQLAKKEAASSLELTKEKNDLLALYKTLQQRAAAVDGSLLQHVEALQKAALEKVEALEKKMLRAEKRKYKESEYRITHIRENIFPNGQLQERVENMALGYARYGKDWINTLLEHSDPISQGLTIVTFHDNHSSAASN